MREFWLGFFGVFNQRECGELVAVAVLWLVASGIILALITLIIYVVNEIDK